MKQLDLTYSDGMSGETVNSAGLDQVRLATRDFLYLRFFTARVRIHEKIILDQCSTRNTEQTVRNYIVNTRNQNNRHVGIKHIKRNYA